MLYTILAGANFLLSVVLVFLVLLHSGKDTGLSGMGGIGGTGSSLGGGALLEKNLDRWTIGVALIWVGTIVALVKI